MANKEIITQATDHLTKEQNLKPNWGKMTFDERESAVKIRLEELNVSAEEIAALAGAFPSIQEQGVQEHARILFNMMIVHRLKWESDKAGGLLAQYLDGGDWGKGVMELNDFLNLSAKKSKGGRTRRKKRRKSRRRKNRKKRTNRRRTRRKRR